MRRCLHLLKDANDFLKSAPAQENLFASELDDVLLDLHFAARASQLIGSAAFIDCWAKPLDLRYADVQ